MRQTAVRLLLSALLLTATLSPAANAQGQAPPHAWLFGAWTGGLFPPPSSQTAAQCLAQPTVIFTRDLVLTASLLDTTYQQHTIQTVRVTSGGAEIRFASDQPPPTAGLFGAPPASPPEIGCDTPDQLTIVRHGENEIMFENCPAFPNPLIRCPAR
jgi:hypothetical protein